MNPDKTDKCSSTNYPLVDSPPAQHVHAARCAIHLQPEQSAVATFVILNAWLWHRLRKFFSVPPYNTEWDIQLYWCFYNANNWHHQHQEQPFYGPLSGTTWVSRYQKKHSPTHHPDHHPIFISIFHLLRSTASSLFKLRAWQSFCTTSFHVLFALPVGLEPSTSFPYISSPNQCLLFTTHAHTIATCFAVVPKSYHHS